MSRKRKNRVPTRSREEVHAEIERLVRERAKERKNEPDPFIHCTHAHDDLAEELAELFARGATTGEHPAEEELNAPVAEEEGGPFVETSGAQEFAYGPDPSNPPDASREPFPKT